MQDRFAFGRATPRYDANQDWKLTDASEDGGYTTLQFERKLETCDDEDIALSFVRIMRATYVYMSQTTQLHV